MADLTRAALIDAAASAIVTCIKRYPVPKSGAFRGSIGWGASESEIGAAAMDAVLPLIADAIETKRAEHFAEYGNEETGPRNYDWALTHAADLVRSLRGANGE